jgi:hypothetical protein
VSSRSAAGNQQFHVIANNDQRSAQ